MAACVGRERNKRSCPALSCSCTFFCSSCQSVSMYSCKLFCTLNTHSNPQLHFLHFFKDITMVVQCYWIQKSFYLLPENQAQVSANKTYGGVCLGLALVSAFTNDLHDGQRKCKGINNMGEATCMLEEWTGNKMSWTKWRNGLKEQGVI